MADQFVAEIRIFAGNFAPTGWALCDGQLMPISQNTALFSLLGTMYGGDGRSTFALPNLQGSAPMHSGQGPGLTERLVGEAGGNDVITLLPTEMPSHPHSLLAVNVPATDTNPAGHVLAGPQEDTYLPLGNKTAVPMNPQSLGLAGSSLPHNNLQPYLVLTFIIALQGVFPPRS